MSVVLALAGNFLREWLRRRSTHALTASLVLAALLLPQAGAGTSSPLEHSRLTVAYGMGFPAFFIALHGLTQAAGLARDIENRRAQLLVTRPVAAWKILVGRWLGVVVANAVLWCVLLSTLGLQLAWSLSREDGSAELAMARERILAPRGEVAPDLSPPLEADVRALVAILQREARPGEVVEARVLDERARRRLRSLRLKPGESSELPFRELHRGSTAGTTAFVPVRFVAYSLAPSDSTRASLQWLVVAPGEATPRVLGAQEALQGVPAEVLVPATAVHPDGSLRLLVRNASDPELGVGVLIDPARVRALPQRGTFAGSVLGASWLLLLQWALLAAVGLVLGVLFRFPTVVLAGVVFQCTAITAGFFRETFALYASGPAGGSLTERFAAVASRLGEVFLRLMPDYSRVDPIDRLGAGRTIEWSELGQETATLLGLAAVLTLVIGPFFLRRRELGR